MALSRHISHLDFHCTHFPSYLPISKAKSQLILQALTHLMFLLGGCSYSYPSSVIDIFMQRCNPLEGRGPPSPLLLLPGTLHCQFSSVAQSCPTPCDPMNRSTPGLPVHHQLPEFTQTHVHRVSDAIQPSHPLSSPSSPAPNPSQHQSFPMSQVFT